MVNETEVLESPVLTPLGLYLRGWMKSEVKKKKKKMLFRIFLYNDRYYRLPKSDIFS